MAVVLEVLEAKNGSAGAIAKGEAAARAAIERQPINVEAVRVFGLLAAARGENDKARAAFAYAERLSRRDFPTQLWLIEDRVRDGDVPGALIHYNRALTTSRRAGDLLFPIMAQAVADPAILSALGAIIAKRPSWWQGFALYLSKSDVDPHALATLFMSLRLRPTVPFEADLLLSALDQLTRAGSDPEALRLYASARNVPVSRLPILRNGGFDHRQVPLVPLDWLLVTSDTVTGTIEPLGEEEGNLVLKVNASEGANEIAALQRIALPPGSYQLDLIAGDLGDDIAARPRIAIICASGAARGASLMRQQLHGAATGSARNIFAFYVTQQCASQQIEVRSGLIVQRPQLSPWIDGMKISARRPGT